MSKHSPGPLKRGNSGWFYDAKGKAIVYSDGEVVSCGPEDERLIAAAPELLEALEGLLSDDMGKRLVSCGAAEVNAVRKAVNAIAKATGAQL